MFSSKSILNGTDHSLWLGYMTVVREGFTRLSVPLWPHDLDGRQAISKYLRIKQIGIYFLSCYRHLSTIILFVIFCRIQIRFVFYVWSCFIKLVLIFVFYSYRTATYFDFHRLFFSTYLVNELLHSCLTFLNYYKI